MVKKCPPGIICIENFTFLFFGLLILTILIFLYINSNKSNKLLRETSYNSSIIEECPKQENNNLFSKSYNDSKDILLNPYSAPLRDDRVLNNENYNGPKISINQPTQSFNTNYRQIGILTRVHGGETILPLMGRPLFSNRDMNSFKYNKKLIIHITLI